MINKMFHEDKKPISCHPATWMSCTNASSRSFANEMILEVHTRKDEHTLLREKVPHGTAWGAKSLSSKRHPMVPYGTPPGGCHAAPLAAPLVCWCHVAPFTKLLGAIWHPLNQGRIQESRMGGGANPPFPFPPLPVLFPFLPSPSLEVGPLNRASGSGQRCKLPQWDVGRSPSRNRIWCILVLKYDIWWQRFYRFSSEPTKFCAQCY